MVFMVTTNVISRQLMTFTTFSSRWIQQLLGAHFGPVFGDELYVFCPKKKPPNKKGKAGRIPFHEICPATSWSDLSTYPLEPTFWFDHWICDAKMPRNRLWQLKFALPLTLLHCFPYRNRLFWNRSFWAFFSHTNKCQKGLVEKHLMFLGCFHSLISSMNMYTAEKLTWTLKMMVWKRNFLSTTVPDCWCQC